MRLLLLSLALSSCSTFSLYQNAIQEFKILLDPIDLDTSKIIKNIPYASIYTITNSSSSIMVLKEDVNDRLTWVDSLGSGITTHNGEVIKTFGLKNDFEIYSNNNLKNIFKKVRFNKNNNIKVQSYIKFNTPETYQLQKVSNFYFVKETKVRNLIHSDLMQTSLIKEEFEVDSIKWKGTNFYWVTDENRVILSKQNITPYLKIRIQEGKTYIKKAS